MKNAILFILVFGSTSLLAQNYTDFPSDFARWGYHYNSNIDENDQRWDYFEIISDTIINDYTYQVVRALSWESPYGQPQDNKLLFFREESKKIFFLRNIEEKSETLTYDFNLQLNDTFLLDQGDTLIVTEEYELYGRRALKLKRLNVTYLEMEIFEEWVEGVGSLTSFLTPDISSELTCFEDDQCECESCLFFDNLLSSDHSQISNLESFIFPNPTNSIIHLENFSDGILIIYDLKGNEIFSNNVQEKMDLSFLNPGVYILKIYNKNYQIQNTHRIIKY